VGSSHKHRHEKFKHAPVIVKLYEQEVHEADLMRELRVDKHRIDEELLRQPGKYAWWGSLYTEVSSKVELLDMRLEEMYGELARHYYQKHGKLKATDLKHYILANPKYQKLRRRLWQWRKSQSFLKHAVRAFDQRLNSLQSYAADQRKEKTQA
jgi:hypothetical protein